MIKWNEYTWYSKFAALILFIVILPILTFYIGRRYEQTVQVLSSDNGSSTSQTVTTNTTTSSQGATQTSTSGNGITVSPYPKPQIISLNPSRGTPGTAVIISGLNFNTKVEQNIVTFSKDGKVYQSDTVRSSSGETLNFSIPGTVSINNPGVPNMPLPAGTYSITVRTPGGTSNAATFTVVAN